MTEESKPDKAATEALPGPARAARLSKQRGMSAIPVLRDLRHFSLGRTAAIARLAAGEALRLRVLVVIAVALAGIVVADMTSKRFDPVLDLGPSLIRISQTAIFTVGLIFAVFLSTYSIPRELTSRTIFSLVTKPVSRLEIVLGKTLGAIAVLGIVILGLGLLSFGYMTVRNGDARTLAAERHAILTADAPPEVEDVEDVSHAMLMSVADHGALSAVTYQEPTQPLSIASIRRDPTWAPQLKALTGLRTHTAHYGFESLPAEVVDGGKARAHLRVTLPTGIKITDSQREVFVRLSIEGRNARKIEPMATMLTPEGDLELPIPGKTGADQPDYAGERFWVSLCGVRAPTLSVGPGDCWLVRADGTRIEPQFGPKLTGPFELGKFLIGGERSLGELQAVAIFEDVPAGRIGPDGTVLRIALSVGGMTSVPKDARTRVFTVVTNPDGTRGSRKTHVFRPEKRSTVFVPLPRSDFVGGTLAVYLRSDVEVRLTEDSIRLQVTRNSFFANWLKHLILAWLTFSVVAGIGIVFSTIAGWQIASLAVSTVLLVAYLWQIAVANVQRYGISLTGTTSPRGDVFQTVMRYFYSGVFGFMGAILPDFARFDRGNDVAHGINIPWVEGLLALPLGPAWYALFYLLGAVILAYLLFIRKEVAV